MENAPRDQNYNAVIQGVDMTTGRLPTNVYVDETTHRLLVSAIITSGSPGGTEYTEGNTDSSLTGFVMMGEKPGDTVFPIQFNSSGELLVAATASLAKDNLPLTGLTEAVAVGIVDSSGEQIDTFGANTEYTEGDVDATINGVAALMEGAGNTLLPIQGTVADGLLVNLGSNNDVTVAGVATAANQTTIIGHVDGIETLLGTTNSTLSTIDGRVDGIEGLLTTIDADTGNMVTALQLIDNAVATIGTTDVFRVAIFDASNNQITSFGGGVEYSDGDANADPTGKVVMGTDGSNIFALHTDTSGDLQIDVLSSALPTGAATSAKQDTIIGHVDGIEGLLTTIDGDTGNISTKIDTIAGAVSGSEMQVDVVGALPAGTNLVGKVGLNDGSTDAVFLPDNTDATGASATANKVGVASRNFAWGSSAAAWHRQRTVENSTDSTGTGITAAGMLAQYDDTSPGTITENRFGNVRMSVRRELYNQIRDAAGNERGANVNASNELLVALSSVPSHPVTNAGTFVVQIDGAALTALQNADADLTTIIGHVDGLEGLLTTIDTDTGNIATSNSAIQTAVELIDDTVKVLGTDTYTEATSKGVVIGAVRRDADTPLANTTNEFSPLITDANGYLKVEIFDGGGSHTVDNNGTFATQIDGSALTALQLIDDPVFADDAGVTLGTHKGGLIAGVAVQTDGTDPTAVSAEADAAILRTDMQRLLIVNQTHPRFWHASADYASAQTNQSVKAAPGASLSLYITDISISNGATAGNITLLDGSGGTVLYEIYPAINGGAVVSLRSPIKLTANTALCITSTTVTTHSIFVSGYIAP